MTETDAQRSPTERRGPTERRKYNRRSSSSELSPPYFEAFERIAVALEEIRDTLRGPRELRLPADRLSGPVVPHPSPSEP
jgi:hypothetical protein